MTGGDCHDRRAAVKDQRSKIGGQKIGARRSVIIEVDLTLSSFTIFIVKVTATDARGVIPILTKGSFESLTANLRTTKIFAQALT